MANSVVTSSRFWTPVAPVGAAAAGRDLLRYMSMGAIAAGVDYLLYFSLVNVTALHPNICNTISRPIAGVVSFLLHKRITFQNRGTSPVPLQAGKFVSIWLLGFFVSNLFLAIYFELFGWGLTLSKVGAEGAAGLFAFLGNRHWTFRKKE
ncbi:MAG: GtrA family protein [Verrucomicrobia bacterium]|nr:GtrA family protein [Verrucomicrobiota bacterium]